VVDDLKNEKRSRVTEFRGQGCNLDALELVSPERFVEFRSIANGEVVNLDLSFDSEIFRVEDAG
jgi:hypothetical protein